MSAVVFVTDEAERQIQAAALWWDQNAPSFGFVDELNRAFLLLGDAPGAGAPFTRARRHGTRRLLLRRTQHWLYYVVDPKREIVYVLALWSGRRGSGPPNV